MISIILEASDAVKSEAKKLGFSEQLVLVRQETVMSGEANKAKIEREIFKLHPYQFLVSDYWGIGPEDCAD